MGFLCQNQPILWARENYATLRTDEQAMEQTLAAGAERARVFAGRVLADVRRSVGLGPVA
jgi:hypothetical protein